MGHGQEEKSDRQAAWEEEEKTQEEMLEDKAARCLEEESRDMISTNGKEICMVSGPPT